MIDNLTLEQREQIESALKSAFDLNHFKRMLMLKLGLRLEDEVGLQVGFTIIVNELVDQALKGGWLDKLLIGAGGYRNGNLRLQNLLQQLGLTTQQVIPPDYQETLPIDVITSSRTLEKILEQRTSFQGFTDFTQRLRSIGCQICRIEIPEGNAVGTGWLVAPNLILTAYHVIMDVHKQLNGFAPGDIACRFDYSVDVSLSQQVRSRVTTVASSWLIDYSPYALADIGQSNVEPTNTELDYALVQLNEDVGEDVLPEGKKRGWIQIQNNPTVMQSNDVVLIPQHPQGRPLELAFGTVLNYNTNANRLRHSVNTENGSSGSPCFDVNLSPFGIHHASDPNGIRYNQCVPLRHVISKMEQKTNVPIFWGNNR
ncbi:trypsin-like serine peptidase [Pontibacter vulgaris]|uniref:trypsin-like serine peptidase n=1 Tax=Pontibacter vulgaris TaxID=2905679 RepID=UPI001FA74954|nr:serine protease [Pontibacter vulgaris]